MMAQTKVKSPSGEIITVEHPDGATEAQILSFAQNQGQAQQPAQQAAPQWSDLPGNWPESVKELGGEIASLVQHPWDAAAGVAEIGAGAISQFFPDVFENSTMQEAEAKAAMVGQAMMERYGGLEEIKNTMITDPAGFAADLGGLLSGGGMLAAKMGIRGARIVSKIGDFVDPVSLAAKTVGATVIGAKRAPGAITGMLSGVGEDVVGELYKAGRQGGAKKRVALRHMRDAENAGQEVLDMARQGMENLRRDKSERYKSGMVDIQNDATVLSFDGIDEAMLKTIEDNTFRGVPKSQSKARALEEVSATIEEWRKLGPEYRTPEGLDALKQRIGDLTDWKNKDDASNRTYMDMYHAVKNTINKQAPVYGDIMTDYADAADQIKKLEQALGMASKTGDDTAFRKLTSAMRNNVNTNFGQRSRLVGELERASGQPLRAAIAGQSASSLTPRGIQGLGMTGNLGAIAYGGMNPMQIPLLAAQSPRIVGEGAVMAGSAARRVGNVMPDVSLSPRMRSLMQSPYTRIGAVQGGRLQQELQRRNR